MSCAARGAAGVSRAPAERLSNKRHARAPNIWTGRKGGEIYSDARVGHWRIGQVFGPGDLVGQSLGVWGDNVGGIVRAQPAIRAEIKNVDRQMSLRKFVDIACQTNFLPINTHPWHIQDHTETTA